MTSDPTGGKGSIDGTETGAIRLGPFLAGIIGLITLLGGAAGETRSTKVPMTGMLRTETPKSPDAAALILIKPNAAPATNAVRAFCHGLRRARVEPLFGKTATVMGKRAISRSAKSPDIGGGSICLKAASCAGLNQSVMKIPPSNRPAPRAKRLGLATTAIQKP
jgi:hypothetical protein